jgi:hypothetical protein
MVKQFRYNHLNYILLMYLEVFSLYTKDIVNVQSPIFLLIIALACFHSYAFGHAGYGHLQLVLSICLLHFSFIVSNAFVHLCGTSILAHHAGSVDKGHTLAANDSRNLDHVIGPAEDRLHLLLADFQT